MRLSDDVYYYLYDPDTSCCLFIIPSHLLFSPPPPPCLSLPRSSQPPAWPKCVIGNFSASPPPLPLPWQPHLSASRLPTITPHLHLEWVAKGDKGVCVCVCVRVTACQCRSVTVIWDVSTLWKILTQTYWLTSILKLSRRQTANLDFLLICAVSGKKNWEKSICIQYLNHPEGNLRCLYAHIHTHTHTFSRVCLAVMVPLWFFFPPNNKVLQAPAGNRSAFLCFTPDPSVYLSVCQSHIKGNRARG